MLNNKIKRVIIIVLDSVGAGSLPDAAQFGDEGANTLGHIATHRGGLQLPHLQKMGLGNILALHGVPPTATPTAAWGKMMETSKGKDTMAGHWELMGLVVEKPFPVFPLGFPEQILSEFYAATGVTTVLGNKTASGTEIIAELGVAHLKTGFPIVYTSADSVFQIAAHEAIIPLDKLYKICEKTRLVCDRHQIGRVIARPFIGEPGNFSRTSNRKDYPMVPSGKTALDILKEQGWPVMGIGKIEDIYAGHGITRAIHTKNNSHGMAVLLDELAITKNGLIFVNLVDFDMLYGHRNDVAGYAKALEEFDAFLESFLPRLAADDLLMITADHGCDPTFPGTDHTREHVPLLVYSPSLTPFELGVRRTFSDVAVTLLELFKINHSFVGTNFFK